MSGKTLSTGTLSLRFMQNAHRAKQMKEVELERAEVKDDGQWQVSQEIREAWGLTSSSSVSDLEVHESYLPFIFSSSSPSNSPMGQDQPRGRRVFGKKGEEIVKENSDSATLEPIANSSSAQDEPHKGRKIHPRPISVTASGPSGYLRGFDHLKERKDFAKSARQAIFETDGVGADLGRSSLKKASQVGSTPTNNVFLKPAGVDEPSAGKPPAPTKSLVVDGAREKKVKRKRGISVDQTTDGSKKQKKEKKKDPE